MSRKVQKGQVAEASLDDPGPGTTQLLLMHALGGTDPAFINGRSSAATASARRTSATFPARTISRSFGPASGGFPPITCSPKGT